MHPLHRRTIYFVWAYREWGGAQIYFLAIMKKAKPDWNVVVLLPRDSMPEMTRYLEELGVDYELLDCALDNAPAPTLKGKLQRQWRRVHAQVLTYRHLKGLDLRGNILHIELSPWQDWIMILLLVTRGANVFSTMHNFPPPTSRWREAVWKARMQIVSRLPRYHIFTSNNDTKNRLLGWVSENFWHRIRVTFTAVNPPQIDEAAATPFDRCSVLKTHRIVADNFIVLCVGQFVDRKGRWIFLDAAKEVKESHPDITFVWLTPELPSEKDQERIDAYDLGDSFRLVHSATLGKDRLDVLRFFRIADVFALPSYVEGLPIALLEAMALKLPSISTNVYAIPEAVRDMETGILIDPGDSRALAAAILKLRDDPVLRAKLSADGRKFVVENFDERDAAATVIAAYKEALGQPVNVEH